MKIKIKQKIKTEHQLNLQKNLEWIDWLIDFKGMSTYPELFYA